jgi:SAM-dependent methyltransferase
MMTEIDLMRRYPRSERSELLAERAAVSEADREIARSFGREYFDGPRHLGLGGYNYDCKFFAPVVADMIDYYGLIGKCSVLDVGCAKGFMLKDFRDALPWANLRGLDISAYCLLNSHIEVAHCLVLGTCAELPFEDKSFDLVVSLSTIHNLDLAGVKASLREIMRVSRRDAYIKVNGYRDEAERLALEKWNLVAKTILHVDRWREVFAEVGYGGDYSFFTP